MVVYRLFYRILWLTWARAANLMIIMDLIKSSPAVVVWMVCMLLISRYTGSAQMFETAKPLPLSSEGKVYSTGSLGVKTGKPTQIIETGKNGLLKVYDTGALGVKTGKPTQIIETGKDGVSKVYETGALGVKTGKPVQVIDNKC